MDTATNCSECEATETVIKKARKSYCRACWKHRLEFQFRKRLFEVGRPAKGSTGEVFKPAEWVLLLYDGSPSSVALINMALNTSIVGNSQLGEGGGTAGKLPFPFKFVILVILESELNGSPGVEGRQKQHLHSLLQWTKCATSDNNETPFPLLSSCLEMSLQEFQVGKDNVPLVVRLIDPSHQDVPDHLNIEQLACSGIDDLKLPFDTDLDVQLAELRKSLKTKTEDKDFVSILKNNLLHSVVSRLNINKVFLPEDQTSLAVKMFSMMSLGRGCQIADEMSFTSSSNQNATFVRPFVDFSDGDLRAYLHCLDDQLTQGIFGKSSKSSTKRKMKIDSVERQCDDFITNLQSGYPSTVSTLTRIGSKLQSTDQAANTGSHCKFCKRQCDSETIPLCYGCQNFIDAKDPGKSEKFRKMLCISDNPCA